MGYSEPPVVDSAALTSACCKHHRDDMVISGEGKRRKRGQRPLKDDGTYLLLVETDGNDEGKDENNETRRAVPRRGPERLGTGPRQGRLQMEGRGG